MSTGLSLVDRYVRKHVLYAMAVVLSLVLSIDVVFAIVEELGDVEGGYSAAQALLYVAMTLPSRIFQVLPFTALGGSLIGLGVMASHNELLVLQSAGVSTWRLLGSVLKPALLIMLAGLAIGEFIAPPLQQAAQSNKALLSSGVDTIQSDRGSWRRIGSEFIHINAIAPGGRTLFGVSRYQLNEQADTPSLARMSFAQTARYVEASGGDAAYWQLEEVAISEFLPEQVRAETVATQSWRVDLSPELLAVLLVAPDRQSISGLLRFAQFFESEGLNADRYWLSFWGKLLQPLATLALVILALSFVFGPLREATMGYRVFIALAVGLIFTIAQRLIEPASLLIGFDPLFAVLLPIALCAAIGLGSMLRVR